MTFLYIKALHIIFVVTWFSGMFYLVRLFVYNREAQDKEEPKKTILTEQFSIMISRLHYGITWPSAILTLIFGAWLLSGYNSLPTWLSLKLAFVVALFLYQFSLHYIYKQQKEGNFSITSNQLRLWNEFPTVILVAVVMLVVVKQNISLLYGLIGLLLFVVVLMSAIRIYQSIRAKS